MKRPAFLKPLRTSPKAVSKIAEQIGDLSVSIAGVAGNVEDAGNNLRQQASAHGALSAFAILRRGGNMIGIPR